MQAQMWIWRAIGLAVVALAVIVAVWFMGQLGDAIGSVDLSTPRPTATATATATTLPSASATSSALPSGSSVPTKRPSPTPKR